MKIEIEITPNDLANIIVDIKYGRHGHSTSFLERIVDTVQETVEVRSGEIDQFATICEEHQNNSAEHNEVINGKD